MIGQLMAAAVGTVAFALLFGAPRRYYPYCGLIGAAGWLLYLLLEKHIPVEGATFLATVLVILLSRMFAIRKRCPVTIFIISGIIPLVPGAGIYWTAYYLVTDQFSEALGTGMTALKVAAAIVLGIVFVFEIPQRLFRIIMRRDV